MERKGVSKRRDIPKPKKVVLGPNLQVTAQTGPGLRSSRAVLVTEFPDEALAEASFVTETGVAPDSSKGHEGKTRSHVLHSLCKWQFIRKELFLGAYPT